MNDTATCTEPWHGTLGGYTNHKCRCEGCTRANRENHRAYLKGLRSKPVPESKHGTVDGYATFGCRCAKCREAQGRHVNAYRGSSREYVSREESRARASECAAELAEWRRLKPMRISYMGAHQKVRRSRGPAGDQHCGFCGSQASDWALIATAKGMLAGIDKNGVARTWSHDPEDYRPLCRPCHKEYDRHVRLYGVCVESGCNDPAHLPPVPEKKGRRGSRTALKCPNNHDLTVAGATRVRAYDGRTECVQCNRDRSRRYRATRQLGLTRTTPV